MKLAMNLLALLFGVLMLVVAGTANAAKNKNGKGQVGTFMLLIYLILMCWRGHMLINPHARRLCLLNITKRIHTPANMWNARTISSCERSALS